MADRIAHSPDSRSPHASTEPMVGWSFLYSKRWIGYFALFVVFSVVCVSLGNWQFDRRAQARAEIARIDSNYDAPPVPLAEALPDRESFDEDSEKWLRVEMVGTYGEPVLARNRPGPQGVGATIIAPLYLEDGDVFFVDRGWVPAGGTEIDDALRSVPMPAPGEVTVTARLRAGEPDLAGRSASGRSVASIDLNEIAKITHTSGQAYTGAYGMLSSESPEGSHGELPPKPERDEGPHLSYALQWYVFILIAGIGVAYAARQEYRGLNAGSEQVRAQDRRAEERKRRRRSSDAEIEDAILDA